MKVPNCPKNLHSCEKHCPMFSCWAYDEYLSKLEREKKQEDRDWE